MQIGENIRACRIEAGLSQEALGERLNVTRQAVSKWEGGVTAPDVALLPRLAQILGVTIDALFSANPPRRYGAYGSRRGELFALCQAADASDADFRRAIDAYAEVILRGDASDEDRICHGMLYHMRAARDIQTAERCYRQILEGDGRGLHWQLAQTELTNLMCMQGRAEERIPELRKWAEREPGAGWPHEQLCYALTRLGRLDEALCEIELALSLNPDDVNVQTMAGDLLGQLGRVDEAVPHWDRAYALDSSCISGWFSKAEAFAAAGRSAEAIAQYGEILRWLESRGYDMQIEGEYPRRRMRELSEAGELTRPHS